MRRRAMAAKKSDKQGKNARGHDLAEMVRAVLREQFGVAAGERIGLGVSGGADSVALLRLFVELHEKLGIVPYVVHFNHQLRGKASDADEKFVAKLAEQHNVPFLMARENVGEQAKQQKANV